MYDKDAAAHTYDQAGAACAVQCSPVQCTDTRGMNSDKKIQEELCSRWDMNYDMKHSFDNHPKNETHCYPGKAKVAYRIAQEKDYIYFLIKYRYWNELRSGIHFSH